MLNLTTYIQFLCVTISQKPQLPLSKSVRKTKIINWLSFWWTWSFEKVYNCMQSTACLHYLIFQEVGDIFSAKIGNKLEAVGSSRPPSHTWYLTPLNQLSVSPSVRPSVHPFVRPSIRSSVRLFVRPAKSLLGPKGPSPWQELERSPQ